MDETEGLEQIDEEVAAMSEAELQEYNDELVDEVKKFIEQNSERNHDQVERIKDDREFAAGQQWDKIDKTNRGENRIEEAIPVIENPISAVVNPISARPFRSIAEPIAQRYDIAALYLFGSYARGEATPQSDLDFRVDRGNMTDLLELGGLYSDLEAGFQKKLDVLTTQMLSPDFLARTRAEEVLIYAG